MPQTQDQVKTQQFRVMVEGVADDLAAHASFAEETMVHRGWVDVEVVRRAQRQLQQALDAYQSETREAGPDLLDKATEPCRVPDTDKIPPDTEVAVSKLDNATDREAWLQGYWAHAFGLDLDRNPYEEHRVWKAWFEGWQWADAEDEG